MTFIAMYMVVMWARPDSRMTRWRDMVTFIVMYKVVMWARPDSRDDQVDGYNDVYSDVHGGDVG